MSIPFSPMQLLPSFLYQLALRMKPFQRHSQHTYMLYTIYEYAPLLALDQNEERYQFPAWKPKNFVTFSILFFFAADWSTHARMHAHCFSLFLFLNCFATFFTFSFISLFFQLNKTTHIARNWRRHKQQTPKTRSSTPYWRKTLSTFTVFKEK